MKFALRFYSLLVAVCVVLLVEQDNVQADRGVGVNLGSINIEDRLAPGGSFALPVLGVINTGDEAGDYEVSVSYDANQKQLRPPARWFEFDPSHFALEPGSSRNVHVRLTLPTGADPGEYFAYLQAHPVSNAEGVTVGVAAATKVSFTVKPSSWLAAQRVRLNRWLDDASPWIYLVPGSVLTLMAMAFLRRNLRIEIRRR